MTTRAESAEHGAASRAGLNPRHARFIALNAVGGAAVLASYAVGVATHPDAGSALWGGVPESLRPLYTVNMFLAAAGYFPFTGYLLRCVDPDRVRFAGRFGFDAILVLYALVLVPSALWLPLTFAWIESPSPLLWALIRVDLALVGLGALGVLAALLSIDDREPRGWHALAVVGCLPFVLQTAVLDAVVWPLYF